MSYLCFFFFNDTATTEIYTLSLHDALPIFNSGLYRWNAGMFVWGFVTVTEGLQKHQPEMYEACQRWFKVANQPDRKSTRLNSSHSSISYAVFCLKKKNT